MKALIGLSGGVDSAVAAWLMLESGADCTGAMMQLYTGQDLPCRTLPDGGDARVIAEKLGIPFHLLDFSGEFEEQVLRPFVSSYEAGLTPNPCVLCNRHLKFREMLRAARELGCDTVVTGHYARIRRDGETGRYLLCKGLDAAKDQSYFLYALTQEQLAATRFPLGELTKAQVREIAQAQGFINAQKRDSQDICFVPDGEYAAFLQRYTGKTYPAGDYLDESGRIVGRHKGAVCYTLGQRKGLELSMGQPVYVCGKDMTANTVTVGPNASLMRSRLTAVDCSWIAMEALTAPRLVMAKARSRMAEQPAKISPLGNGAAAVEFLEPQRALTPGQAIVFYDGDTVLGGGTISEVM